MPRKFALDQDEVQRVNRVRVAAYLKKMPHEIDEMPVEDFYDVLAIMLSDREIQEYRNRQHG